MGHFVPGSGQLCFPHFLRGLLHVLVHPAPLQRGHAGAAQLQNFIVLKHLEERIDLFRLADELKHHAVRGKINDLGFVDAADLPQLRAVVDVSLYLQQQQLPLQGFVADPAQRPAA